MNSAALSPIFDHVRTPLVMVLLQLLPCPRSSRLQVWQRGRNFLGPVNELLGSAGVVGGFPRAGLPPSLPAAACVVQAVLQYCVLCSLQVVLGGGQEAMDVTTTSTRIGKFEARLVLYNCGLLFVFFFFEETPIVSRTRLLTSSFSQVLPLGF